MNKGSNAKGHQNAKVKSNPTTPAPTRKSIGGTRTGKGDKSQASKVMEASTVRVGHGSVIPFVPTALRDVPGAVFTLDQVRRTLKSDVDAGVPTKVASQEFAMKNEASYYLAINMWLLQIRRYSEDSMDSFSALIEAYGLIYAIKLAVSYSDRILDGLKETDCTSGFPGFFVDLALEVSRRYSNQSDQIRNVLSLFRFLKRFSPDGELQSTIDGILRFYQVERENDTFSRRLEKWHPYQLDRVRELICDMIHDVDPDPSNGFFSNGSSLFDEVTTSALGRKIIDLAHDKDFLPLEYSLSKTPYVDSGLAKLQAVPKSYKSPRLIAMETPWRGWHAQSLRTQLESLLRIPGKYYDYSSMCDVRSQEHNRELCARGSVDGSTATIDMSNASDRVTWALVKLIFPEPWVDAFDKYRPRAILADGQKRRLRMFATSGSPLTFIVESMVHLAVDIAAVEYYNGMTTGSFTLLPGDDIAVFGDDQVVPAGAAQTVIDTLGQFGLECNTEKSFISGFYRESCGVEYYDGISTSNVYWPRKCLIFDHKHHAETISSLLALQHVWYTKIPSVGDFIARVIKCYMPDMTYSRPGDGYEDIWSDFLPVLETIAPHASRGVVIPIRYSLDMALNEAYLENNLIDTFRRQREAVANAEWHNANTYLNWARKILHELHPIRRANEDKIRREGILASRATKIPSEILMKSGARRELHAQLVTEYKPCNNLRDLERDQIELYRYMRFLKEGPVYDIIPFRSGESSTTFEVSHLDRKDKYYGIPALRWEIRRS